MISWQQCALKKTLRGNTFDSNRDGEEKKMIEVRTFFLCLFNMQKISFNPLLLQLFLRQRGIAENFSCQ